MSEEIQTAPPRPGTGCFGKGCALLAGLLAFLTLALLAGTFWGIHFLRGYSATEPLRLPVVEGSAPAASGTPVTAPATSALPMVRDWASFQRAARRGEAVTIELTADEINRLIAESDDARGKVFVSIADNVGRVQVSLPLADVPFMKGRHLNGELQIASSPDGDPAKVRVLSIILNGQPVPEAFLDRSLFGYPSLRSVVEKWIDQQRIATFRIAHDRALGESRGSR